MSKLAGKVAWISGATSGIGEATARLFAREGAKVAVLGRHLAWSRRVAAALNAEGLEALAVAARSESLLRFIENYVPGNARHGCLQ